MNRAGHFAAMLAAIPSPVATYDTSVPLDADGEIIRASYAVGYDMGAEDPPDDERYTEAQRAEGKITWLYIVKSVGTKPFAARSVDSAVASGLVGAKLTVPGRDCDPLELDDVGPVKEDTSVSPPLYFIESGYLLTSKEA